ncbi:MAG TPA: RDD family protein [Burkholderiales bacterium]|nr:RDD family protein [Burkholderiales bacterium]
MGGVSGASAGGAREARSSARAPALAATTEEREIAPSLVRRLASLFYEALVAIAVAFFAGWLFFAATAGRDATEGWLRHALQLLVLVVLAGYYIRSWLRGGQTLAMRAWRIRVMDITPRRALLRFLYALVLVPTGISILWAFFDRDRQFLHDRLAGTRLVLLPKPLSGARPTT